MSKGYFSQLTEQEQKEFKRRQLLINEAIDKGSFTSRKEVKAWLKDTFKLSKPLDEVSTEYSLTKKQKSLFYIWLLHFTGKGPRPHTYKPKSRITDQQLHRIKELWEQLGWNDQDLYKFVKRQVGKQKIVTGLWKNEATKVITGMERILAEQPFKLTD